MKCIRSLSSIALVSFLSINSGVAMSKVPEQVPQQTSSAQTEPMIIANPFRMIQEGVRTVDQINQIRLREQRRQEAERRRQEQEAPRREATEKQPVEQAPVQVNGNEDLYQRLARRSGESHEKWYDRTRPIINTMPGANYRAWKATLSIEDREAFDAITKQKNYEAREMMNRVTPLIFNSVLEENRAERDRLRRLYED
jgi:hypothetical protein